MGKKVKVNEKKVKKQIVWRRLWGLLEEYNKIMIVSCDHVGSKQFQEIRTALRPMGAHILMGKNTLLKKGIERKMYGETDSGYIDYDLRKKEKPFPELEKLIGLCKGNTGLIFCKDNICEVKKLIGEYTRERGAKIGAEVFEDVWVKKGATGMDPKQTAFFQALNIPTKIVKTQIDIQQDVLIVKAGEKIGTSECALLDKLNIRPFNYSMKAVQVYDNGAVYAPEVLDLSEDDVIASFKKGCSTLAALCLQVGYPTQVSVPHSILAGFKSLAALSIQTTYDFDQAAKIKEMALNPDAFAVVAEKPKEVEEEKPVDEEPVVEKVEADIGGMDNLFGGDDEDEW